MAPGAPVLLELTARMEDLELSDQAAQRRAEVGVA